MKARWALTVIAAGSLLASVTNGALADSRWDGHDRDSRHYQADREAERHREWVRAEEAREAERHREWLRAEEARRHHRRHGADWRDDRDHNRRSERPFGYIGAADRERHRSW